MKETSLPLFNCPVCSARNFSLEKKTENEQELREGNLICRACNQLYSVNDGLIFLYDVLSDEVVQEQVAAAKEIAQDQPLDERAKRMISLSQANARLFFKKQNLTNKKILELGAGDGWLTAELAANNQCVAFDMFAERPRGLKAAEQYFANDIFFERVVGDMIKLPFKEESFDAVVFCAALHHASNLEKALAEVNRVLKIGGQLYLVNEPARGFWGSPERLRAAKDWQEGFHEARYTLRQWLKFIKQAGFIGQPWLPENMSEIIASRLKIRNFWQYLPNFLKRLVVRPILTVFDGFFNVVAVKQRKG